jgi:inosine-uridine nucleoside N-ribohydrolase
MEARMLMSEADRVAMLAPRSGRIRAVLDTDTFNEIDDQFALVYALMSPERISLEAIYAAPFVNERAATPGEGMERSFEEVERLLERLGMSADGLVYRGVCDYVGPKRLAQSAPAVDDLISRARACSPDDPLYVIAIAAISNVASALLIAPDIAKNVVVVWLGGHALEWPDTAEFNLRQDVEGAQVLLDCGVPVVLIPCRGVTTHLHTTIAEIDTYVRPHGAIGEFLADRFADYCKTDSVGWSKVIWDMAAIAYLLDDKWARSRLVAAPILGDTPRWSFDSSRHLIRYVDYIARDPIFRDFFTKLADWQQKNSLREMAADNVNRLPHLLNKRHIEG